jgi:hypothetical protein
MNMKNLKMYLLAAIGGTILVGTAFVLTGSRIQAAYSLPKETPTSCNYRASGPCGNGGTLMVLEANSNDNCRPTFCSYALAR